MCILSLVNNNYLKLWSIKVTNNVAEYNDLISLSFNSWGFTSDLNYTMNEASKAIIIK